MDDSLDVDATTTTMTNWPTSNGQFVDGEDDIFDNDDELQGLLDADNEAPEEVQVCYIGCKRCFKSLVVS